MSTNINGYNVDEESKVKTAGGLFWQAEKGGTKYCLKRFVSPKRPGDRVSETVRKRKNEFCDAFAEERKKIIEELKLCTATGIFAPVDFFEFNSSFYLATEWKTIRPLSLLTISALPPEQKDYLFKRAALQLLSVHSRGIIHMDIRPDNIPVSYDEDGIRPICTLIDFDSACFEDALPAPEITPGTYPYMSPELFSYMIRHPKYGNKVTTKNDVFALAIVFHEYWTGRKFIYKDTDDKTNARYLYQAVDNNERIDVAPGVPEWLDALLHWMIRKNPDERPTMSQVLDALFDHTKIEPTSGF